MSVNRTAWIRSWAQTRNSSCGITPCEPNVGVPSANLQTLTMDRIHNIHFLLSASHGAGLYIDGNLVIPTLCGTV
ncbi:hypothetical protein ABKN59_001767 [Abortiporus biennis]